MISLINYILDLIILFLKFLKIFFSVKKNVFIYQMGKVGSQSLFTSLDNIKKYNLYHDHHFSIWHQKLRNKNYLDLRALYLANLFGKKIYVICPIRDPFKRNISMFFNQIKTIPKLYSIKKNYLSFYSLKKNFINKFDHDYALNWIDFNLLINFNIDVYSKKFNKKRGYQTYDFTNNNIELMKANHLENFLHKKNVKILIFKCELDNKKKKKIIKHFLNTHYPFEIIDINKTIQKEKIKSEYNMFKKKFKFSNKLNLKYKESKFYKHFY